MMASGRLSDQSSMGSSEMYPTTLCLLAIALQLFETHCCCGHCSICATGVCLVNRYAGVTSTFYQWIHFYLLPMELPMVRLPKMHCLGLAGCGVGMSAFIQPEPPW
jgi:hypothetical protein